MFHTSRFLKLIFPGLLLLAGLAGAGERDPSAHSKAWKIPGPAKAESIWLRDSRGFSTPNEGKPRSESLRVLRWEVVRPEAPHETSESHSMAIEKRLTLRN